MCITLSYLYSECLHRDTARKTCKFRGGEPPQVCSRNDPTRCVPLTLHTEWLEDPLCYACKKLAAANPNFKALDNYDGDATMRILVRNEGILRYSPFRPAKSIALDFNPPDCHDVKVCVATNDEFLKRREKRRLLDVHLRGELAQYEIYETCSGDHLRTIANLRTFGVSREDDSVETLENFDSDSSFETAATHCSPSRLSASASASASAPASASKSDNRRGKDENEQEMPDPPVFQQISPFNSRPRPMLNANFSRFTQFPNVPFTETISEALFDAENAMSPLALGFTPTDEPWHLQPNRASESSVWSDSSSTSSDPGSVPTASIPIPSTDGQCILAEMRNFFHIPVERPPKAVYDFVNKNEDVVMQMDRNCLLIKPLNDEQDWKDIEQEHDVKVLLRRESDAHVNHRMGEAFDALDWVSYFEGKDVDQVPTSAGGALNPSNVHRLIESIPEEDEDEAEHSPEHAPEFIQERAKPKLTALPCRPNPKRAYSLKSELVMPRYNQISFSGAQLPLPNRPPRPSQLRRCHTAQYHTPLTLLIPSFPAPPSSGSGFGPPTHPPPSHPPPTPPRDWSIDSSPSSGYSPSPLSPLSASSNPADGASDPMSPSSPSSPQPSPSYSPSLSSPTPPPTPTNLVPPHTPLGNLYLARLRAYLSLPPRTHPFHVRAYILSNRATVLDLRHGRRALPLFGQINHEAATGRMSEADAQSEARFELREALYGLNWTMVGEPVGAVEAPAPALAHEVVLVEDGFSPGSPEPFVQPKGELVAGVLFDPESREVGAEDEAEADTRRHAYEPSRCESGFESRAVDEGDNGLDGLLEELHALYEGLDLEAE
jgi:hypothetical protein